MITHPVYRRIRASLNEFSTITDPDEYAAFITRQVLSAKEKEPAAMRNVILTDFDDSIVFGPKEAA